jgi:flagellar biosynthesis protein FlhF
MRLRTFSARTMTDAMAKVRLELGPDAIIVSTQEDDDGTMRVTAAMDEGDLLPTPVSEVDVVDILGDALARHGLSPALVEKILAAALRFDDETDPHAALARALSVLYPFEPIVADNQRRVLLMVGPPGAGKTVSIAKLATRAVMAGKRVRLVTADITRAGGIQQLESLAAILKLRLTTIEAPHRLAPIAAAAQPGELMLIDSPGVNPYSAGDRRELASLVKSSEAEPVLVVPAGGDMVDTVDMAGVFRDLGCNRMIVTRLDMVRRLGSVLTAADQLEFGFAEAGIAPAIANGLSSFTPVMLARLLLPQTVEEPRTSIGRRGRP